MSPLWTTALVYLMFRAGISPDVSDVQERFVYQAVKNKVCENSSRLLQQSLSVLGVVSQLIRSYL